MQNDAQLGKIYSLAINWRYFLITNKNARTEHYNHKIFLHIKRFWLIGLITFNRSINFCIELVHLVIYSRRVSLKRSVSSKINCFSCSFGRSSSSMAMRKGSSATGWEKKKHFRSKRFLKKRRNHLISRIIVLLQVRMGERFLHGDAVVRVEGQHLAKQIEGLGVSVGEQFGPRYFGLEW